MGATTKKLLTIDATNKLMEMDVPENMELLEKENCVMAGNICYPFDFFAGIQLCNEEQYKALKGIS